MIPAICTRCDFVAFTSDEQDSHRCQAPGERRSDTPRGMHSPTLSARSVAPGIEAAGSYRPLTRHRESMTGEGLKAKGVSPASLSVEGTTTSPVPAVYTHEVRFESFEQYAERVGMGG